MTQLAPVGSVSLYRPQGDVGRLMNSLLATQMQPEYAELVLLETDNHRNLFQATKQREDSWTIEHKTLLSFTYIGYA